MTGSIASILTIPDMSDQPLFDDIRVLLKGMLKNLGKMEDIDHELLNRTIREVNKRIREHQELPEMPPEPEPEEKCPCRNVSLSLAAGLKWCDEHDRFVSAYSP